MTSKDTESPMYKKDESAGSLLNKEQGPGSLSYNSPSYFDLQTSSHVATSNVKH